METDIILPKDFVDQVTNHLGKSDYGKFQEALTKDPIISIRVNPLKKTNLNHDGQVPWCNDGLYLNKRPSFTLDPVFHAGGYYVQEASSMFLEQVVTHSVDLKLPLKVLDLCAAPGGKSTHLLSFLNPQSLLVSNEVIRSRANILCENIQKWGAPNVVITQNDPTKFNGLNGFFDLVVVDAPCSGEGLFRKEREAISEWSASSVELCSQRQQRILSDVFPALKQNGILIYCTCTYNPKENEENLNWLSAQHNVEFISIPLQSEWGIEEVRDKKVIGYRFYPHRAKGEGFFISAVRKKTVEKEIWTSIKEMPRTNKKAEDKVKHLIKNPTEYAFITDQDRISLWPKEHIPPIAFLTKHLHVLQVGTALGEIKHEKIIPDHALALSNILNKEATPSVELDRKDALHYLRKENFPWPHGQKGFVLIRYEGLGLGWVNSLSGRINNLYPTNWRIRMRD